MDDLRAKVAAAVEAKKQAEALAAVQRDYSLQQNAKHAEMFNNSVVPLILQAMTDANSGLSGTGLVIDGRQEPSNSFVCTLHGKQRAYNLQFSLLSPDSISVSSTVAVFHQPSGRTASAVLKLTAASAPAINNLFLEFVSDALDRN